MLNHDCRPILHLVQSVGLIESYPLDGSTNVKSIETSLFGEQNKTRNCIRLLIENMVTYEPLLIQSVMIIYPKQDEYRPILLGLL